MISWSLKCQTAWASTVERLAMSSHKDPATAINAHKGVELEHHSFLSLATENELPATVLGRCIPTGTTPVQILQDWPQSRSAGFGEEKNLLSPREIKQQSFQWPTSSLVSILRYSALLELPNCH
jgi:hypothetical protein